MMILQQTCLVSVHDVVTCGGTVILGVKRSTGHELNGVSNWILVGSALKHFLNCQFDDVRCLLALNDESNCIFLFFAI
jgi:hypothetical protein